MALARSGRLYALTSLQVGDIQSYVSRLFLLVACDGLKLVFLVDNGPWTVESRPWRPAELWQLLVYKSRGSPFTNRLRDYANGDAASGRHQGSLGNERSSDRRAAAGQDKEDGWLALLVALQRSCKEGGQVRKLSHGLYGCVAFEVAWSDVRGINYTNELQTDTCVSLEVRVTTKREFDSLEQAQACYDTILSGAKDVGPSVSVSKMPGGKTAGAIVRCKGPDNNLQGLIPEQVQVANGPVDNAVGGLRRSKPVDKRHMRRRQLDESTVSYLNGSGPTQRRELSRAYMSSLTSWLGPCLHPESLQGLPEFFTPPSSPYNRQVLNLFKNCSSRQNKDLKKACIVPVDEELQIPVCENIVASLKEAGESVVVGSASATYQTTSCERKHSTGVFHNDFDCPKCRVTVDGTPVSEKVHECLSCSASVEVGPDCTYIHPDRLIAPAEIYRDTLILFRFSEPLLPLELQQIITKDRRLLKMLESGLPPWVIFVQSYPILCHLYRPWMRPLCGTIYYLISIVTVLIGFYDLYKNVPVLKAAAAHICLPLFEWIDEWGMVSRLKYLGTMLFLQNCEKAFEWAVAVTQATRQISMVVMRPVLQPLMLLGETFLPLWVGVSYGMQALLEFLSAILASTVFGISSVLSMVIWPFIVCATTIWNLGKTLLYPVFSTIWTCLIFPVQLLRLVGSLIGSLSLEAVNGLQDLWLATYDALQLLLASGSPAFQSFQIAKSSTPGPSMWRTLWNDILSKVFHALNGIVKGLAAFITACNRHRLSIYNQLVEFLFRASHMLKSGHYVALTAFQQLFLPPDPSEVGTAAVVEVEPEQDLQVPAHIFSERTPTLRYRPKGTTSLAPLLLMQG